MSDRKTGWGFSVERPVAVQSPSMFPFEDVQTKLNFSSRQSPTAHLRNESVRNFNKHSEQSPLSPLSKNRLADYHMSKQNPDVLDRMYSSSFHSSPGNDHCPLNSRSFTPPGMKLSVNGHTGRNTSILKRAPPTPTQMSLLKQALKANRGQSSFGTTGSSLVQLATRKRLWGVSGSPTVSPVVVRLSRGANTHVGDDGIYKEPAMSNGTTKSVGREEGLGNPCDKDVVLSALRKRRKRWAASSTDESFPTLPGPSVSGQPLAKRPKHWAQPSTLPMVSQAVPSERKRTHNYNYTQQSSSSSKRSKSNECTSTLNRNKIFVPEIEYESDSDDVIIEQDVEMANAERVITDNDTQRADMAKVQTQSLRSIEDDGILKKREDSLTALKTVFPSVNTSETSLRREVPVFCATGQKPRLPTLLSTSHCTTQEDLRKDREATNKKITEFLTLEKEETDSPDSLRHSTKTEALTTDSSKGLKTGIALGVNPNTTKSTNLPTSTETVGTTKLSKSSLTTSVSQTPQVTKAVSFSNPPISSVPTASTDTNSINPGFKLGGLNPEITSALLSGGSLELQPSSSSAASTIASGLIITSSSGLANTMNGLQQSQALPVNTQLPLATKSLASLSQVYSQSQEPAISLTSVTASLQFGVTSTQPVNVIPSNIALSASTAPQLTTQPSLTLSNTITSSSLFTPNTNSGLKTSGSGIAVSQEPGKTLGGQSSLLSTSGLSFGSNVATNQSPSSLNSLTSSGGFLIGKNTATSQTSSLLGNITQPSGGLMFGSTTTSTLQGAKPSGGLMFGNKTATLQGNTAEPSGGLLFGNSTASTLQEVKSSGGLMFGNNTAISQTATLQGNTAQPSDGLLFGNTTASTLQGVKSSGGLMFGNNTAISQTATLQGNTAQPNGGLMFGNNTVTSQTTNLQGNIAQPGGGLLFGNTTASTLPGAKSSGGLMFGKNAATSQTANLQGNTAQPSGGLMFGSNTGTSQTSVLLGTQPNVGFSFLNSKTNNQTLAVGNISGSSGNASLSSGQAQQPSIFGNQATSQASNPTHLTFGNTTAQTGSSSTFSFSAASVGGSNSSFTGNTHAPQTGSSIFNGGLNNGSTLSKPESSSLFGGNSTKVSSGFNFTASPVQIQQSTGIGSEFSFTVGHSNPTQKQSGNNGTQLPTQQSFNFGSGIGQNQNTNGFSFKENIGSVALNSTNSPLNMNMISGGKGLNGIQAGSAGNIFNSPMPAAQTASGKNPGAGTFSLPAQQTPTSFNFPPSTPNNSGVNFGTPSANLFAAGVQGNSTGPRPTARSKRKPRRR